MFHRRCDALAETIVGSDGSRCGSAWRRPRWGDGRLISPLDDGISKWVKIIVGCSTAAGFWLHGQVNRPGTFL